MRSGGGVVVRLLQKFIAEEMQVKSLRAFQLLVSTHVLL
jgi:hypothetical protein